MSRPKPGIVVATMYLAGMLGCYRGVIQVPPEVSPVSVLDMETGSSIGPALVLPRYVYGMSEVSSRIEHPFVHSSGEPLTFILNESWGVESGEVLLGKAVNLEDVLIFAPGYRPLWLESDFLYDEGERSIRLKKLELAEAALTLSHMTEIMNRFRPYLEPSDLWLSRDQSMVPEGIKIEIHFTTAEKKLVRQFLAEALTTLAELNR